MTERYELGDVELIDFKLEAATRTVDLRGQAISVSIFEDVYQPTLYCEIIVVDAINLTKLLKLKGEETISISFFTKGNSKITTYDFVIYGIQGVSIPNNNKLSTYTIRCTSIEHYTNNIVNVERYFKDSCSSLVSSICRNYLNTSKNIEIESTKGIFPVAMPSSSPFKAVDYIRQKSVSASFPTGGFFVFFENQDGFHFRSIEGLFRDGVSKIGNKIFTYATNTQTDIPRERKAWRNLTRYEHLQKVDTVSKLVAGTFSNNVKTWDIFTKDVVDVPYFFSSQGDQIIQNGGTSTASSPNSDSFVNQMTDGPSVKYFMPIDTDRFTDFIPDYRGSQSAFEALFQQNIVRCMARGDNLLKAGDVVTLNIPDAAGFTDNIQYDKVYTGNYLITRLRHIIHINKDNIKHDVSFDCNMVGLNL